MEVAPQKGHRPTGRVSFITAGGLPVGEMTAARDKRNGLKQLSKYNQRGHPGSGNAGIGKESKTPPPMLLVDAVSNRQSAAAMVGGVRDGPKRVCKEC